MKWICSQIGAREHYAVPRVLHRLGKLDRFYTDLWAGTVWQTIGVLTGRSILGTRFHEELADAKVTSFDGTVLIDSIFGGDLKNNPYDWFHYVGKDFGARVTESLKRQKMRNWSETIFFGYDTGFLEPAEYVKSRGGKTIVCQMDPSRVEVELIKEEGKRWPSLAKRPLDVPEIYFKRREAEWAVADRVIVNSKWSMQALMKQGVPEHKLVVVPLAYETGKAGVSNKRSKSDQGDIITPNRPLRALFLGQVVLRKGIQYLIEAARILGNESVHFDVVGSIGISQEGVKSAPKNMTFHGLVKQDETKKFYRSADLFILPTLSDGFALTQLEAMAYELPVIVTPNCGEVVTHGVDGLIVPEKDSKALAEAIRSFLEDPGQLRALGHATQAKVQQFGMQNLSDNLEALEKKLVGG
jgi:glycosyltransferase involved in cell wall biosynthesis